MTTDGYVISLHNVAAAYGERTVLRDLSLDVERGVVFGLLGVNGAGKTTLLRLILGLLVARSGTARVLGYDGASDGREIRLRSGVLLEHHGLYERLTALENLEFHAALFGLSPAETAARAKELLEKFGLWGREHERIGSWSRGMQVRLALTRALLHRPALLLLDEPTSGLDPVAAQALRAELGPLALGDDRTVILTTHNLSEAERMCTHIGILHEGRIVAQGATRDVVARSATATRIVAVGATPALAEMLMRRRDAFDVQFRAGSLAVTAAGAEAAKAIQAEMVSAGATVIGVESVTTSLESAFLSLLAS